MSKNRQLTLLAPEEREQAFRDCEHKRLWDALRRRMGTTLDSLTLTDNRTTLLTATTVGKADDGTPRIAVRIQRCFADAPDPVLQHVARYASGLRRRSDRRIALAAIRGYVDERIEEAKTGSPSPIPPRPELPANAGRGRHHDLVSLYAEIEARYFEDPLGLDVVWGRRRQRRTRRRRQRQSIQLGCYVHEDQLIRIHPALDRAYVPAGVIRSILYHEMLHAVLPCVHTATRTVVHTDEFRRRERAFPDYERATAWLKANLSRLLRDGGWSDEPEPTTASKLSRRLSRLLERRAAGD